MTFQFDQNVSASLSTSDLYVERVGGDTRLSPSGFTLSYDTTTNIAKFSKTSGTFDYGYYTAKIYASDVSNSSGTSPIADIT